MYWENYNEQIFQHAAAADVEIGGAFGGQNGLKAGGLDFCEVPNTHLFQTIAELLVQRQLWDVGGFPRYDIGC